VQRLQDVVAQLAGTHVFIDLQCNIRSRWFSRQLKAAHGVPYFTAEKAQLARSRLIVEARLRGRRRPLPEKVRRTERPQFETMCDALRKALRHHLPVEMRDGVETVHVRPHLPIPLTFDAPWRKELKFGTWLGIAPGAAHATKQAPLELVHDIIVKVRQGLARRESQTPVGLVFFGDNNDRRVAREVLDQLGPFASGGPVLNLAGRLSLWESAVALRETSCLLSNDSSLGHIAEAVDTPVALLFGPTVEAFGFTPHMRESRAFSAAVGCRPCSKHGKIPCRYADKLCFNTLSPEDIANHLVELLVGPDPALTKPGRRLASESGLRDATS
jgi:ADP-heptose:LPS heptosyltransferase